MNVADALWLIPVLPLAAAGVTALCHRSQRRLASGLAIGALATSLILALAGLGRVLSGGTGGTELREVRNFDWFDLGPDALALGWVLDPLGAVMLVMVTLVGLLIFVYSVAYMADDPNFTRFFCFLSLFAAAMLGLVMANSLLLLFICWELVGLASYLLIGFWFQKPAAAAAAQKAFITTRIGDIGFLLGMVWWYGETGTLVFYDGGSGCLEGAAMAQLAMATTAGGLAVSTGIGLLIFFGAMGKSGQVPLHVWLPDAMEGPTPVSALIHAATMVAAGVFLVARVYPLMEAVAPGAGPVSAARVAMTWVGAFTALFAALVAVAQTDLKRILAYSTVSQLGYMFLGLGTGGVAVAMFHLITHAFFKALLFLGAGSVIHGCHGEQDIRRMGGLRRHMPITFATYGIGMLALAGVPLLSGFWSKDEILHAAHGWTVSRLPFWMGLVGAALTAFYMTRQVARVFYGEYRGASAGEAGPRPPHESPALMTVPLIVLAVFAALLGLVGTPLWPGFQRLLGAGHEVVSAGGVILLMLVSTMVVASGLAAGWWLYGRGPIVEAEAADPLEAAQPVLFEALRRKLWVDELYERTVIRWVAQLGRAWDWLDTIVVGGMVTALSVLTVGFGWVNRVLDEYGINPAFDEGCRGLREGGGSLARLQNGQVQHSLRSLGLAFVVLLLLLTWGCAS
jgi:NADH-quinone oxidoreductase subunit L